MHNYRRRFAGLILDSTLTFSKDRLKGDDKFIIIPSSKAIILYYFKGFHLDNAYYLLAQRLALHNSL
jgi:hypothetical protein